MATGVKFPRGISQGKDKVADERETESAHGNNLSPAVAGRNMRSLF